LSRSISQGLYRLVHDLRPAQLDDLGLVPAVKYLLEKEFCPKGMEVPIEVHGTARRLDPLVETVLFRVAQEALKNTARHAGTTQAKILLTFLESEVGMLVQDRGRGFDATEPLRAPRGWGLAGMRERVESVGGKFELHSAPGEGTIVDIRIPVEAREEAAWKRSS
jgi:two-component system sensor histidine kinase UhpB